MRLQISRYVGYSLPLFWCGVLFGQPARCTQDTIVGTYALATQGSMLMTPAGASQPVAVPFVTLAIASIDSAGAVSGQAYGALGETITKIPGGGSIQVNEDCTAVAKTSVGSVATDVILDEGREIRSVMIQVPTAKPIVQGVGKRISRIPATVEPVQCSSSSVHGVYAVTYQGTYMMPQADGSQSVAMPALTVALISVDYDGQLTGRGTMTLAGNPLDYQADGHLDVNTDCSALAQMSVQSGMLADQGKAWIAVLDGGNELWAVQIESAVAKPVTSGTWKRISPIPWSVTQ